MADWIAMFDEILEVQGPPTPEQLARIPARRGVLALLGQNDEPITLITAADMRARLRNRLTAPEQEQRTKAADLREITRRIAWKRAGSHFETDLHYLELASAIWPDTYASMLAWKPAWFVHVDSDEEFPRFVRTRDVGARAGRYVGPFLDGRTAERFIDALQDAFDLCRDYRCLRQSPQGPPCSYAQMGRCVSPCDGSMSMDEYRGLIARAADFAAGRRESLRGELAGRMQTAAGELDFEQAAALKSRIERLGEFELSSCAQAMPLDAFRFVAVQSSGSTRRAAVFLVHAGSITPFGPVDYPANPDQLVAVVEAMAGREVATEQLGRIQRLRIGLVSRYLFSGPHRRGLFVRWREGMTAQDIVREMEEATDVLKLRAPRVRKPKDKNPKAPATHESCEPGEQAEKKRR